MNAHDKEQIRLSFLRVLDEKKGTMSDREVAQKAGLSNSAISHYRTGKSKEPTGALLNALSHVLGYDDEWGLFHDLYSVESKESVSAVIESSFIHNLSTIGMTRRAWHPKEVSQIIGKKQNTINKAIGRGLLKRSVGRGRMCSQQDIFEYCGLWVEPQEVVVGC